MAQTASQLDVDDASAIRARTTTTASDVPWAELVPLVRGTVRRILGPTRELDDLTQTVLERVVRGLDTFEGRAELTTFVYRVAVNVALNHWRSWRRWLKRFDPSIDTSGEDQHHATSEEDQEGAHVARERGRRLHGLLERLDANQRIAVILADFEDLPGPQIAEIVGCPEATVRSRLRLGRAKLAQLVLQDPFFREEVAP
jgi:RNA polymerase sigma-70 factor (ECF subfamily)